jgi:hypothetical protein
LIQTQQILPVTALGVALAPHFVFRRGQGRRATDPVDDLPFESRDDPPGEVSVDRRSGERG